MSHILSKSTFIRGQQCQKSLYLNKKRPFLRDKISAAQLAKFKRGTDIGTIAQGLFPGGINCKPASPAQYEKKIVETQEALMNRAVEIIYEAVFQYDEVLILLDILVRDGDSWKAYEVKSSRSISETYIIDASLQYYVMEGCGLKISEMSLIYVNENYVMEEEIDLSSYFVFQKVTDKARSLKSFISEEIARSKQTLQLDNSPSIPVGLHCFDPYTCDFLGHCWKNIPENSFVRMDTLQHEALFASAYETGFELEKLPKHFLQTKEQQLQFTAFNQQKAIWDLEAIQKADVLNTYDAEKTAFCKMIACQYAMPFMQGTKPYQNFAVAVGIRFQGKDTFHYFTQNASGYQLLSYLFTESLPEDITYVFDDDTAFRSCIEDASKFIPNRQKIVFQRLVENVTSISQLGKKIGLFLPVTMKTTSLGEILRHLTGKEIKLKDETYLQQDILSATADQKHKYDVAIKAYLEATERVFLFLQGQLER